MILIKARLYYLSNGAIQPRKRWCAVEERRRWFASRSSSSSLPPLKGRPFVLSEKQAQQHFERWYLRFVPSSLIKVGSQITGDARIVSVRPVLIPFYGLSVVSRKQKVAVYGGYDFADQQVEALTIDPSEWTRFDNDLLNTPNLYLDTWSLTPAQAVSKAQKRSPDMQLAFQDFSHALLPGYMFEYSRNGLTYKVFVSAVTGKASGLKHYSIFSGIKDFATVGLRGGNLSLKMFLLLTIPRLIPPIGIGMLIWSVFRSFLSPAVTLGIEKLMKQLPSGYAEYRPVQTLLDRQWGHYDPASDQASSFSAEQEAFFRQLFGEFERAFRESRDPSSNTGQNRRAQWGEFNEGSTNRDRSKSQDGYNSRQNRRSNQSSHDAPPPKKEDLYQTLGVSKTASSDEIRQGFRRKLLQYHPDQYKGKDPEFAKQKTQEVVEAYRILNNPAKRSEYDAES